MNGGESFSWAKRPAVPENRKRATIERKGGKKFCQKCALQGIRSPIQLFQLNDEEALLMCKNVDCTFMPTSNWEALVVKRDLSRLTVRPKKKGRHSSSSSASSYISDQSIHSAPQIKGPSGSQSTPLNRSCTPNSGSLTSSRSAPQHHCSAFSLKAPSPASSLDGKTVGDRERKTFVPIAPFLCGHAHSFSSFETNKLDSRRQQSLTVGKSELPSEASSLISTGKKRRTGSLDSDSLSSGSSSLDSRPSTPTSDKIPAGKKVQRVIVPPETLTKLLEGSLKVGVRKEQKGHRQELAVVFKPAIPSVSTSQPAGRPVQSSQGGGEIGTTLTSSSSATPVSVSAGDYKESVDKIEVTPVGFLHDILKSNCTSEVLPVNLPSSDTCKQSSIQSHIDAINQHLHAIKALGGNSVAGIPFDLSTFTSGWTETGSTDKPKENSERIEATLDEPIGNPTSAAVVTSRDHTSISTTKTSTLTVDTICDSRNSLLLWDKQFTQDTTIPLNSDCVDSLADFRNHWNQQ